MGGMCGEEDVGGRGAGRRMQDMGERCGEEGAEAAHPCARSQNSSKSRLRHLETLHGFVSAATKELMWLNEKEEEEVNFDWSDRNPNMTAKKENYSVWREPGTCRPIRSLSLHMAVLPCPCPYPCMWLSCTVPIPPCPCMWLSSHAPCPSGLAVTDFWGCSPHPVAEDALWPHHCAAVPCCLLRLQPCSYLLLVPTLLVISSLSDLGLEALFPWRYRYRLTD